MLSPWQDLETSLASEMADDGFQVVKKRKGYKCRNHKEKNGSCTGLWISRTSNETITCDVNELKTKIEKRRHEKVYFVIMVLILSSKLCLAFDLNINIKFLKIADFYKQGRSFRKRLFCEC